ncbi:lipoprotein YerB [Alteribacter lacisalsi]|uniref:Lipoprotein YerB n=1 Tax=Alteribacter lacisalsi TaxID=2045244 RepID=A0A2W0H401_9BACI|nr:DUF3048 domain-containing protein [Alteribacter lacisalsi]PYZ96563.1 lipoprotein YerB [Alteribacter lacisalsi]
MKTGKWLLSAVLCFGVLAAACSGNDAAGEDDIENAPGMSEESDGTPEAAANQDSEYAYRMPLTGIGSDQEVTRTAFGVMMENSVSARPQTGLYQADLVYEVLSEGNITRFLTFYHSNEPEEIGPVRSARDYYVHLNNGYNAIYVSAGGSSDGLALAESPDVPYISGLVYDGRYFSRSAERSAPHNMYTSYEDLVTVSEQLGHDLFDGPPELPFSGELSAGKPAVSFEINYGSTANNVAYKYDAALGGYQRFNGGVAIIDHRDGTPVAPASVFAVEMEHRVIDELGRRDIDISSGGDAYLFREGTVEAVEWKNVDGAILPFKDGEPVGFSPGQTWINVMPDLDRLTIYD